MKIQIRKLLPNESTSYREMCLQCLKNYPEYQGRSIGSNIIKHTLNEAFKINGIEQIEIGVISINEKAEKIYKKMGFEEFGLQLNFLKIDNLYYDHKMMMVFKNRYTIQ